MKFSKKLIPKRDLNLTLLHSLELLNNIVNFFPLTVKRRTLKFTTNYKTIKS